MLPIRRMYTVENVNTDFVRRWQGHQVEQRWFSAIAGSFTVKLIEPDSWEQPSKNLPLHEFLIDDRDLNILHVPPGFISSIQANEEGSKLLVFADYGLGEISDEYRFPADYFN